MEIGLIIRFVDGFGVIGIGSGQFGPLVSFWVVCGWFLGGSSFLGLVMEIWFAVPRIHSFQSILIELQLFWVQKATSNASHHVDVRESDTVK